MDSTTTKTAFYYYSGVFILATLVCSALIGFLKWPLLAEIPLAVCIFIQIIALSRSVHKYWDRFEGRSFLPIYLQNLKLSFFTWKHMKKKSISNNHV